MATGQQDLLKGIVEADETYIGGKPRNKGPHNKRGMGTDKSPVIGPVIGMVARGGNVVAGAPRPTKTCRGPFLILAQDAPSGIVSKLPHRSLKPLQLTCRVCVGFPLLYCEFAG